jgi:Mg2+/Co2+ transporter CorB
MNGLVLEQLESIPDGNVSFNINNFKFETVEINGNRVKKVAVTSLQSEQAVKSV